VEQAATVAAQDNMELACAFIQKTAIEKAIPEIDKRLLTVSLLHLYLVSSKLLLLEEGGFVEPLVFTLSFQ
jgi:hypothetical protein